MTLSRGRRYSRPTHVGKERGDNGLDLQVASLWIGSPLSFVERICIQSFLDNGYTFHLYVLDTGIDVPEGVTLHDAREIYIDEHIQENPVGRKRAAVFADIFRIYLMQMTPYLWVDLDIYCAKPLDLESDYIFGVVRRNKTMNNCVLRLPPNSLALKLIMNFLQSEVPLPFWLPEDRLRKVIERYEAGHSVNLYDLPWTTSGPSVTRWALTVTGEIDRGQHWHLYWPRRGFLDPDRDLEDYEPEWIRFHHFQGETRRGIRDTHSGLPPKGSYIDFLCHRHDIRPESYPVL